MKATLKLTSGIKIQCPTGDKVRPTTSKVREAILNILRGKIEGSSWLDLCSGSGSMGCEALQNGAKRILAIEKNKATAAICKENLIYISEKSRSPQSRHVQVICDDVISLLNRGCSQKRIKFNIVEKNNDERFDLIYLDPPYKENIYEPIFNLLLSRNWVKKSSILICECSTDIKPLIPKGWHLQKQKAYGNCCIIFLIPNQALRYFFDIGSKH